MDIDVVFPWVDGTDLTWNSRRHACLESLGIEVEAPDVAAKRYKDFGTAERSLRSVLTYLPFVNTVYIVTASQTPPFLEKLRKEFPESRIELLDHTDFIDEQYLPAFSSLAITPHFCKIPNLSEHFINVQDDMIFLSAYEPSDFFTESGEVVHKTLYRVYQRSPLYVPVSFYETHASMPIYMRILFSMRAWLRFIKMSIYDRHEECYSTWIPIERNSARYCINKLHHKLHFRWSHFPTPFKRSLCREVLEDFQLYQSETLHVKMNSKHCVHFLTVYFNEAIHRAKHVQVSPKKHCFKNIFDVSDIQTLLANDCLCLNAGSFDGKTELELERHVTSVLDAIDSHIREL